MWIKVIIVHVKSHVWAACGGSRNYRVLARSRNYRVMARNYRVLAQFRHVSICHGRLREILWTAGLFELLLKLLYVITTNCDRICSFIFLLFLYIKKYLWYIIFSFRLIYNIQYISTITKYLNWFSSKKVQNTIYIQIH